MNESEQLRSCCCGPTEAQPDAQPCGDREPADPGREARSTEAPWIVGSVRTAVGEIPRVGTTLGAADRLGAWKVRWGIGRMRYRVEPGLYAVGAPTADCPVMVSANYKVSFDRLRSQLDGRNAWILVLETRGINVWCAAGKGTFGTDEIVRQVEAAQLAKVVSHRTLIVPQLGAPGVAAHEVKQQSGFRVVYGPVRAEDLSAFLDADMKATPEMRQVVFPFRARVALIPVELAVLAKYVLLVAGGFFLLGGLGPDGYSWVRVTGVGARSAVLFLVACVGSTVFIPALLPWLPGRAFAAKGAWLGLAFLVAIFGYVWFQPGLFDSWLSLAAWCLLIPSVASFMAMNFTGATTYTSLSGVRREMRVAVPIQVVGAAVGVALWVGGRFV